MQKVSRTVTATILSMSLLTVMAGAAIAPAMGIIKQHFADAPAMVVQLVISLPALFIIVSNLFFAALCRRLRTRSIALLGLLLYVVAGAGCALLNNLYIILVLRALLGISVGLIMPLSTGLLSYYYPPEEQAKMMGLSVAMNQMGGVVGTLLAGILAAIEWNYAFLVYLLGLVAVAMIACWLPNEKLTSEKASAERLDAKQLLRFHPSVTGMLLLSITFYVFPTNFAIITGQRLHYDTHTITWLMVALDFVAFLAGLVFGNVMQRFRHGIKYFAPLAFLVGYFCYVEAHALGLVLTGSALIGLANGVGMPYLLTIASIKGGRMAATTVMPLLSIALYLGQFLSPLVVLPLAQLLFGADDIAGPYKVAMLLALLLLLQTWLTRHFQSLPPEKRKA